MYCTVKRSSNSLLYLLPFVVPLVACFLVFDESWGPTRLPPSTFSVLGQYRALAFPPFLVSCLGVCHIPGSFT
jgi:hypothetical protein